MIKLRTRTRDSAPRDAVQFPHAKVLANELGSALVSVSRIVDLEQRFGERSPVSSALSLLAH
ncbi:hypothetical protein GS489_12460 [Rhodococcus hoagii]|nr:hypothetical protein [Prescottella equi]